MEEAISYMNEYLTGGYVRAKSLKAHLSHLMSTIEEWYIVALFDPSNFSYKLPKYLFKEVSLSPSVTNLFKTFATTPYLGYFSIGSNPKDQYLIRNLLNRGHFKQIFDLMKANKNITIKIDVDNNAEFANLIDNTLFGLLKEIIVADAATKNPKGEQAIIENYKENIYDGEMPIFANQILLLEEEKFLERIQIAMAINRISIWKDYRSSGAPRRAFSSGSKSGFTRAYERSGRRSVRRRRMELLGEDSSEEDNYDPSLLFNLPSDIRTKILQEYVDADFFKRRSDLG